MDLQPTLRILPHEFDQFYYGLRYQTFYDVRREGLRLRHGQGYFKFYTFENFAAMPTKFVVSLTLNVHMAMAEGEMNFWRTTSGFILSEGQNGHIPMKYISMVVDRRTSQLVEGFPILQRYYSSCTVCQFEYPHIAAAITDEMNGHSKAVSATRNTNSRRKTYKADGPYDRPTPQEFVETEEDYDSWRSEPKPKVDDFQLVFGKYLQESSAIEPVVNEVIRDLEHCFRRSAVYIYKFGSMVTKLNVMDSDCDFFVERSEVFAANRTNVLSEVHQILQRSHLFGNMCFLHKAQVPIVKCTHLPTGMKIDINSSCPRSMYSTALVAAVARADPRLHDYLVILKIWAKTHELIGRHNMTSYCIVMLGVFYLQQAAGGNIVPPLSKLFQIDDIDYTRYASDDYVFPVTLGVLTIPHTFSTFDAVKGFFAYYSALDFDDVILCPYVGHLIRRDMSHADAALWVGEMNIHSEVVCNVGKPISRQQFGEVRRALNKANNICNRSRNNQIAAQVYASLIGGVTLPPNVSETGDDANVLVHWIAPCNTVLPRIANYLVKTGQAHYSTKTVWLNHMMKIIEHIMSGILLASVVPVSVPGDRYAIMPPPIGEGAHNYCRIEEYRLLIEHDMWTGREYNLPPVETASRLATQMAQTNALFAQAKRARSRTRKPHVMLTARLNNEPLNIGLEFRSCSPSGRPNNVAMKGRHPGRKFCGALKTILNYYSLKADLSNDVALLYP